jgi:hypothetical protein
MSIYLHKSSFLPYLNNEKYHEKYESNKEKFSSLNLFMMVEFSKDEIIYPYCSANFCSVDGDDHITKMEETYVYQEDTFGL